MGKGEGAGSRPEQLTPPGLSALDSAAGPPSVFGGGLGGGGGGGGGTAERGAGGAAGRAVGAVEEVVLDLE